MLRDRTFVSCFAISLFLHLTMVTLFSIELRYERKPIQYYPFDIVDVRGFEQPAPQALPKLDLPPEVAPAAPDDETDRSEYLASLPKIALPTLAFDEIPTVSLREPSYEAARPAAVSRDAWARFGEEIQDVRAVLRNLPVFDLLPTPEEREAEATDAFYPLPDLRAHVEWLAEPRDRRLLFTPPLSPQWRDTRAELNHPVTVMFQVDPDGSVGEVIAPVEDLSEPIDGVVEALKGYRFEPQPRGSRSQSAALVLEPGEAEP